MKKQRILSSWLFAATLAAGGTAAIAAELQVYVSEDGMPVTGAAVVVGGDTLGTTGTDGAAAVAAEAGEQTIRLVRGDEVLAEFAATLSDDAATDVSVYIEAGAAPQVLVTAGDEVQAVAVEGTPGIEPEVGVGLLTGTVRADGSQAPIEGVLLTFRGQDVTRYARTDANGEFLVELPSGSYDVELSHPQFGDRDAEVMVQANVEQATTFGLSRGLAPTLAAEDTESIEEVVVRGTYIPGTADREQFSESIVDVISAEDFAVTPDSDAVEVLARVTGITVVGSKYVYVRGLGERYSNTTFNGALLPSPDPVRRVIPLDLFPAGVLEQLEVTKTYAPNLPGDFSGGTVQLITRKAPLEPTRQLEFDIDVNSQTTGEPSLTFQGGDRDLIGIDDGFRDLPETLNRITEGGTRSLNLASDEELRDAGLSLRNIYDVRVEDAPADFGVGVNLGDRWETENGSFGYLFGASYDNGWHTQVEQRATFGLDFVNGTPVIAQQNDIEQFRSENSIELSSLLSLEWEINDANLLRSTTFLTRSTESRVIRDVGVLFENDFNVADTTIEWEERQLISQQFTGEHFFDVGNELELGWFATVSQATREEPDTRFYRYRLRESDGLYLFESENNAGNSNERSWEDLTDDSTNFGVDLAYPVEFGPNVLTTFKAGVNVYDKERDSSFRRFRFQSFSLGGEFGNVLGLGSPEEIFQPQFIGRNLWELRELTQPTDNYTAEESIDAAYLMVDSELGNHWRWMIGARYEDFQSEAITFELANPSERVVGRLDEQDVLPATTLTWIPRDDMQFRAGLSRTVNRPDLKELSPAPFLDPEDRFQVVGNPNLQVATIDNYDLRWEWYLSSVDSVQLALFYKEIDQPIERIIILGGQGLRTFANADSATNEGIELSVRNGLGFISDRLENFYVNFNGSLIDSEVDIGQDSSLTNRTRELQGQSPWVVNFQFGYDDPARDIQALLLFNMSGEYIADVGTQGLPDAKVQPVERLDLVYRQMIELFGQRFRLKATAENLLDPDYEMLRGDAIERSWTVGRTYGVSLDWEF